MIEEVALMERVAFVILSAAAIALSGCETWDKLNKTEKGAVIGGGTGVIVGSEESLNQLFRWVLLPPDAEAF